jgi:cell division septal protein FtsQ
MDRSRRGGAGKSVARADSGDEPAVPPRSRLTARPTNRRRPPPPERVTARAIANACGRAIRRGVPVLTAAGVITVIGLAAYGVHHYLTTSPRFAIATIEVRGTQTLTADEIRGLLTARIGDNVFTTDVQAETAALRAEPWIATAEVRRELPDTLVVEIEERAAAAVVALDTRAYLADERGVPFRRGDLGALEDGLPVITGLDRDAFAAGVDTGAHAVRAALAAITQWRANPDRPPADEIHVDAHGSLAVHTRAGLAIELGAAPDDIASRLRRFDLAWSHLTADERSRARAIHVDHATRQDHVIVAFAAKD